MKQLGDKQTNRWTGLKYKQNGWWNAGWEEVLGERGGAMGAAERGKNGALKQEQGC